MGFIISLMCLACFGSGLMLLFAKNAVWQRVVWRNRRAGIASERTAQWDANATSQGIVLIVMGFCLPWLLLLTHPRHAPALPQAGQMTITVDGRPATPQEREIVQSWSAQDKKSSSTSNPRP